MFLRHTTHESGDTAWFTIGLVLVVAVATNAEDPERATMDRQFEFDSFRVLSESAEGLDWDAESQRWLRAVDKIWERNGWNTDAHESARKMIHEVAVVPPWDFMGRFKVMTEHVRDRYDLSPEQTAQMQGVMIREVGGMLVKHGGLIFDQSMEVLRDRAAGKPFTSDQVARLTRENEALFRDARKSADRVKKELTATLSADQRVVWDRDWAAFDERFEMEMRMRTRWAAGGWEPEQWGLDEDPIQLGKMRRAEVLSPEQAALSGKGGARVRRLKWIAHEPSTWHAYILDFEKRFDLDAGQMSTAESIHAELFDRATGYLESYAEQVQAVPKDERATHEAYDPVRMLFSELQSRLDALPTTSQRSRSGE